MRIKIIIVIYFISYTLCAQNASFQFQEILNNKRNSDSIKEVLFTNLLKTHWTSKALDALLIDNYNLSIWYYKNKEVDKAISQIKSNIILMDSIHHRDALFYRKNIYSLAVYLKKNNQPDQAIEYYDKVLKSGIIDDFSMFSSFQIGVFFFDKENYYKAIDYFETTYDIGHEVNRIGYITTTVNYLAVCYRLVDKKDYMSKALNIVTKQIDNERNIFKQGGSDQEAFNSALASLYHQLGNIYANKTDGDFEKAIFNFQNALNYAYQLNNKNKSYQLALIYHDIGNTYAYNNDKTAFEFYNKVLKFTTDKILTNQLLDNKANLYKRLNEFEKSKINNQLALKTLSPNINDNYDVLNSANDYLNSSQKYLTINTLINKAEIYIEEAHHNDYLSKDLNLKALEILKITENVLDAVRLEYLEYKTKLFWRNNASRLYTNAIKVCFALKDHEKAFYFMEKNKALLLLEDVVLEGKRNNADIPNDITEAYNKFRREVIKYESASDSFFKQKLVAKANYNTFIDSLDAKYKPYFKSIEPAEVISLNSFQNSIEDTKQAFIEYILGEKEGFGMLITKETVELFAIHEIESLRSQINEFKSFLKKPKAEKAEKERYNRISYSIYNSLFPERIRTNIEGKSLQIIPDDILLNIPFEALQTSNANDDYLIYKHQISYANSLTFLSQNKLLKRQNTKNAIGFAPIRFHSGLPTLENSKTEIETLGLIKNVELLEGEKATKQSLVQNLTNYKLVHISTHASMDGLRNPYLVMSDSLININELSLTRNSAELVVLSACETANGELYKGEGVLSLSRSFFNTGAKSVVSTLWAIDDKTSSEIMTAFYSNLNEGQSKSEALHHAKTDYLKSHSLSELSPYYWASFILIGDNGPIDFHNDNTTYYFLLALSFTCFTVYFFWKCRRLK